MSFHCAKNKTQTLSWDPQIPAHSTSCPSLQPYLLASLLQHQPPSISLTPEPASRSHPRSLHLLFPLSCLLLLSSSLERFIFILRPLINYPGTTLFNMGLLWLLSIPSPGHLVHNIASYVIILFVCFLIYYRPSPLE